MNDYLKMSRAELEAEKERLLQLYGDEKKKGLKLDMSRGKPCPEQLDLSMDLLKIQEYRTEAGADTRNYGFLEGIPEARRLFGELLGVDPAQVLVGGNSSLQLMYDIIAAGCKDGLDGTPWNEDEHRKFLCQPSGVLQFKRRLKNSFNIVGTDITSAVLCRPEQKCRIRPPGKCNRG